MDDGLLPEKLDRHISSSPSTTPLRFLSAARSLALKNSSASAATVASIIRRLLLFLSGDPNAPSYSTVGAIAISILAEIAAAHPSHCPEISTAFRSFLTPHSPLAAPALSVLSFCGDIELDAGLLITLASSPIRAVQSRAVDFILTCRTSLGSENSVQVLLPLTSHHLPLLRRQAAEGLVVVLDTDANSDSRIVICCFDRAIELLKDDDELVRLAAIQLVSVCGKKFVADEDLTADRNRKMDLVFLQLCTMARDMSLKVRIEIFTALGKVQQVAETLLLQSLSRKVLKVEGKSQTFVEDVKECQQSFPRAAGAFMHGLHDDFNES